MSKRIELPPRWVNNAELAKMRNEHGLTQRQLAIQLGLRQAEISKAENGQWITEKAYKKINDWMGERNTAKYL